MNEKKVGNINIENAQLIFKNFQGKKKEYNEEGNRNFGVLLEEEFAHQLEADGWNIRRLKPRPDDPEEYRAPWLSVKVRFNPYPPTVVLINSRGRKKLDEQTIDMLDWSYIKSCDLIIRPYQYPAMGGRPAGISAYLKAIYVTIQEDTFAEKYADLIDLDHENEE